MSRSGHKRRNRRFFEGVGWIRPKTGYVWTLAGNNVRKTNLPAWGSRKFGTPSIAEERFTR